MHRRANTYRSSEWTWLRTVTTIDQFCTSYVLSHLCTLRALESFSPLAVPPTIPDAAAVSILTRGSGLFKLDHGSPAGWIYYVVVGNRILPFFHSIRARAPHITLWASCDAVTLSKTLCTGIGVSAPRFVWTSR